MCRAGECTTVTQDETREGEIEIGGGVKRERVCWMWRTQEGQWRLERR